MIVLFTDFGVSGPYVGQMTAVLRQGAPDRDVVNLFADAPAFDPMLSAYLLPAYVREFPEGSVFLCVVDPGVGSDRAPGVLLADGRWFVGPDNGLFELVARRAMTPPRWWEITWRPERLSASFHGRDLFAPVAAHIARGDDIIHWGAERPADVMRRPDWPDDLARVVYVDGFGNAMTGLRASAVSPNAALLVGERRISAARTFSDVPPGGLFCYENSNGLMELAVNKGRADVFLGLKIGDTFEVEEM